ncbi:MAG: UvrD-helicase domain-containing protein, partial [Alphaproteobacteria bacterium]
MSSPQQRAADPTASAFVRANAGSGKTKTLIDRTARLLLEGADPAAILCVTYTRAAAAEMQRRLFALLGEWSVLDDAALARVLGKLVGRPPEIFDRTALSRARQLFARALETPGGLKIQTIHGFCERLLRRFPIEAGIAPGFEVIDEGAAAEIARAARDQVADRVLAGNDPVLSEAYARMSVALDFQAFQSMFASFETERAGIEAWMAAAGGLPGLLPAILTSCGLERLEDAQAIEEAAVLPPQLDPRAWFAAAAALARGTEKTDQPRGIGFQAVAEAALRGEPQIEKVRGLFFTKDGPARSSLATKGVDPEVQAWLAEELTRLSAAFERARATRVAEDTLWVMMLAVAYLDCHGRARRARGALDFGDLVEKTRSLLREKPAAAWVLYKLDLGIDHVLVDEAQDTSPKQWEIIRTIVSEFMPGGARPNVKRTVFAVGDEKQSIFSFQGAQPKEFDAMRRLFARQFDTPEMGWKYLKFHSSFRSGENVLGSVDQVFRNKEIFASITTDDVGIPEHKSLPGAAPGLVEVWPLTEPAERKELEGWDAPFDTQSEESPRVRLARRIATNVKLWMARG